MNRQQRRKAGMKGSVPTYNLTEGQLKAAYDAQLKAYQEETRVQLLTLTLALPLRVMMDHYWKKTYHKKLPEFAQYLVDYYQAWESGELTTEELQWDLWEYGGIRLEAKEE